MNRPILQKALTASLCFCLGVVMVFTGRDWSNASFESEGAGPWSILNAPALRAADWWTRAGLPPTNEAAWVVTPAIMVLTQWTLVGVLAGLYWSFRTRRKNGQHEAKTC